MPRTGTTSEILFPFKQGHGFTSPDSALKSLAVTLTKCRSSALLVFNPRSDLGAWYSVQKHRRAFHERFMGKLTAKNLRSVWLVFSDGIPEEELLSLKNDSDFFLNVRREESRLIGQFLAGKRVHDPAFFVPRTMVFAGDDLVFADSNDSGGTKSEDNDTLRQQHHKLLESTSDGVLTFHLDTPQREVNKQLAEMLGYSMDEMLNLQLPRVIPAGNRWLLLRSVATLRKKGKTEIQTTLVRKSGRQLHARIRAAKLSDDFYLATIEETTREIELEASLSKAREIETQRVKSADYPIAIFTTRKLVFCNRCFRDAFAWLGAKLESPLSLSELFGRRNAEIVKAVSTLATEGSQSPSLGRHEVSFDPAAAGRVYFEITAYPMLFENKKAVEIAFVDVTAQHRLQAQRDAADERFRTLLDHSIDAASLCEGTRILSVNPAFLQMYGFASQGDVAGKELPLLVAAKRDRALVTEYYESVAAGKSKVAEHTFQGIRGDRTLIQVEVRSACLSVGDTEVVLTYHRDVTARVRAEATLSQRTRGIEIVDGITSLANEAKGPAELRRLSFHSAMKALGFEHGAFLNLEPGTGDLVMVDQLNMPEKVRAALERVSSTEGLGGYILKTGEPLAVSLANFPPFLPFKSVFEAAGIRTLEFIPLLSKGSTHSVVMLTSGKEREISDTERATLMSLGVQLGLLFENAGLHEKVRHEAARFESVLESIPEVFYSQRPDGSFASVSANVERLLGFNAGEFTRMGELWRTSVHPEDRPILSRRISNQSQAENEFELQYRMLPKGKATYRWVTDTVRYVRDGEGVVTAIEGRVSDISDRLALEQALAKSEEAKSNVLESVKDGVVVLDLQSRCVEWNKTMEAMTGVKRERVRGRVPRDIAAIFAGDAIARMIQGVYAGADNASEYVSYTSPSTDDPGELWVRFSPLRDRQGTMLGAVGILSEVTSQRHLEREVRESEETLRNTINAMGDSLIISDLQGTVWEVNTEFCRFTGYNRAEVLGTAFPYPWLVEEDMASFVRWISELREKNYLRDFDMVWQTKEGERLAISLNTTLLRNALGEPVAMLNIARDISERKQLSSELERRNEELSALNAISSSISKSLDIDQILEVAGLQIQDLLHTSHVLFYLFDPSRHHLVLAHQIGVTVEDAQEIRTLEAANSLTGVVTFKRKPEYIEKGVTTDERVSSPGRELMKKLGVESLGVVPLQSKQKVLGAMDVTFIGEHRFTAAEMQLLPLVGNQLAGAIENARLYAEVQSQVDRVTSLYELGKALTGELEPKALLHFAYERIAKSLPVHRVSYYRWIEDAEVLRLVSELTPEGQEFDRNGLPGRDLRVTEDSPYWTLVKQGKSFAGDPATESPAAVSVLAVPVKTKHRVVGALVVGVREQFAFDANYLRLLESIANLTQIAIDKATLHEDAIAKSNEIESRNRELDDFTYVVSHDLKEPLISIEGFSRILLKDFREKLDAEGEEYLRSIVSSTDRMKALIDDLLMLSRVGRVVEKLESIPVTNAINEILRDLQFQLKERNAVVTVAATMPTVRYSRTGLSLVFRNLISNALKFNDKPAPKITIDAVEGETEFVLSVADNGIGIEKKYFDRIFQIFQRLQRSEQYRGTGAGLTIVKKVIEKHHGRIWVESESGQGTAFHFTVPKGE